MLTDTKSLDNQSESGSSGSSPTLESLRINSSCSNDDFSTHSEPKSKICKITESEKKNKNINRNNRQSVDLKKNKHEDSKLHNYKIKTSKYKNINEEDEEEDEEEEEEEKKLIKKEIKFSLNDTINWDKSIEMYK